MPGRLHGSHRAALNAPERHADADQDELDRRQEAVEVDSLVAMTLTFMKKGVYRLGTTTVEMPSGGMDVKTVGPDNHLRLVVTVA